MTGKIIYEKKGSVAYIKLSNPGKYNAIDVNMRRELIKYLDEVGSDDDVRVVVITGDGEHFSAGADLTFFKDITKEDLERFLRELGTANAIGRRIRELKKPVIAVVKGYCLGGGFELVQFCDIILASEGAIFGQPELRVGLIPGGGGTQNLPRLIGDKKARELIYTGNFISARELEKLGLVNKVLKDEEIEAELERLVNKILGKSPLHIAIVKESINNALETPLSIGLRKESELFKYIFETEDTKEGIEAFLEKRKPKWRGR